MQVRDTHRNYDEVLQMFNAMLNETNEEGLTLAEELKEHNKFLHTHSEPEEKARLHITEFNKKVVNHLLHEGNGFVLLVKDMPNLGEAGLALSVRRRGYTFAERIAERVTGFGDAFCAGPVLI